MKPIRLSVHAQETAAFRGATEADVVDAVRDAPWLQARGGRLECKKDSSFERLWNGRIYTTRQIRPIFVEEADEIVVVTVYVYYF